MNWSAKSFIFHRRFRKSPVQVKSNEPKYPPIQWHGNPITPLWLGIVTSKPGSISSYKCIYVYVYTANHCMFNGRNAFIVRRWLGKSSYPSTIPSINPGTAQKSSTTWQCTGDVTLYIQCFRWILLAHQLQATRQLENYCCAIAVEQQSSFGQTISQESHDQWQLVLRTKSSSFPP